MSEPDFGRIARGLMKAVSTPTDELAARRGEDDLMVRVKRNSDRLNACDGHDFVPQPDWRNGALPFIRRKVHCARCGGDMDVGDAMHYLRGFAHAKDMDPSTLTDRIWPPQ